MAMMNNDSFEQVRDSFPLSQEGPREVPLAALNVFAQQRVGRNERQDDLTRSIRALGLLYPVNAVLLEQSHLEGYLEFTNRTWHEEKTPDQFTPIPEAPFCYVALIAGHSRRLSCEIIADEDGIDHWDVTIPTRIHPVSSIGEMLAIQAAENTHSAPPPDRAARGYAEAFLYEKEYDPDLTKTAFANRFGLPRERFNDALRYCELPDDIRAATDDGGLPFSLAIELSRALEPIKRDVANQVSEIHGIWSEEATETYDQLVVLELWRFITQFNADDRNITAARRRIRSHAAGLRKKLSETTEVGENYELFGKDARELMVRKKFLIGEIKRNMLAVAGKRADEVRILELHAEEVLGQAELFGQSAIALAEEAKQMVS